MLIRELVSQLQKVVRAEIELQVWLVRAGRIDGAWFDQAEHLTIIRRTARGRNDANKLISQYNQILGRVRGIAWGEYLINSAAQPILNGLNQYLSG